MSSSSHLDQVFELYVKDPCLSHYPVMHVLTQLLSDVTHDDRMRALSKYDILNRAAMAGHTDILATILRSVQQNKRLDAVLVRKNTPLHYAAAYGNLGSVNAIISQFTVKQQLVLLSATNGSGKTPADWASMEGHKLTVDRLISYKQQIAEQQQSRWAGGRLDQVLELYTRSPLQCHPDMSELTKLLSDVTHDDRMRALNKYDSLNRATMAGHTDILATILRSVQQNKRLDAVLVHCQDPLHYAAASGKTECVNIILSHFTAEQQLKLIAVRDMSALIFYTKEGREEGATEEAALLDSSLRKVAGNVLKQEWSKVTELEDGVLAICTELSSECPLLVVSVMSHGRMGALYGSDDIMLPVNDLIEKISNVISPNVKLVLLIQACQVTNPFLPSRKDTDAASIPVDAKRGSAVGCMHIDLVRPNTVLLMATATGGSALRVAYVKALAAEISKADGVKDMHQMHTDAVKVMRDENGAELDDINQHPLYKDICDGTKIVLPAAASG